MDGGLSMRRPRKEEEKAYPDGWGATSLRYCIRKGKDSKLATASRDRFLVPTSLSENMVWGYLHELAG